MTQAIKYEHYRPPVGLLDRLGVVRGSTPTDLVRRYYRGNTAEWVADPKGGVTMCTLTTRDGAQFTGEGNCSVTDIFCFAEGRKWAFKYAVDAMLSDHGIVDVTDNVILEEGIVALMMPVEHAKTLAKYLKTFMNTSYFSDTARNELYKAIQHVFVHGDYLKN